MDIAGDMRWDRAIARSDSGCLSCLFNTRSIHFSCLMATTDDRGDNHGHDMFSFQICPQCQHFVSGDLEFDMEAFVQTYELLS